MASGGKVFFCSQEVLVFSLYIIYWYSGLAMASDSFLYTCSMSLTVVHYYQISLSWCSLFLEMNLGCKCLLAHVCWGTNVMVGLYNRGLYCPNRWLVLSHRQERSCWADKTFHAVLSLCTTHLVLTMRGHPAHSQARGEPSQLVLPSKAYFVFWTQPIASMLCFSGFENPELINLHWGFNSVLSSRKVAGEAPPKVSYNSRIFLWVFTTC